MFLRTRIAFHILESKLDFVLSRNVFPCSQEDLLLHVTVLSKEYVNGYDAREVEHVNVVLDCNLHHKMSFEWYSINHILKGIIQLCSKIESKKSVQFITWRLVRGSILCTGPVVAKGKETSTDWLAGIEGTFKGWAGINPKLFLFNWTPNPFISCMARLLKVMSM